jgi:enoyl-CoA hydratase/carnithine racemase
VALVCDILIAAAFARFSPAETLIGILPGADRTMRAAHPKAGTGDGGHGF